MLKVEHSYHTETQNIIFKVSNGNIFYCAAGDCWGASSSVRNGLELVEVAFGLKFDSLREKVKEMNAGYRTKYKF